MMRLSRALLVAAALIGCSSGSAASVGTSFTYQGRLTTGVSPTLSITDNSITRTNLRSLRARALYLGPGTLIQPDSGGALSMSASNSPVPLVLGVAGQGNGLALVPEDRNDAGFRTLSVRDDSGAQGALRGLKAESIHVGSSALILSGSGDPNGAVTAAPGSLFLRTDGGAKSTLYVKTNGFGNSGWGGK